MKGWTLQDLEDLDGDTYRVLIEWINESSSTSDPEGSIDMDAVIDAKHAKARRGE
jgi:hypothetical protein